MLVTDNVTALPNAAGGELFTAAGTGLWVRMPVETCVFEAILSDTTAPYAEIEIHGSNRNDTVPCDGTRLCTLVADGAKDVAQESKDGATHTWKCAVVVELTGTDATARVTVSAKVN